MTLWATEAYSEMPPGHPPPPRYIWGLYRIIPLPLFIKLNLDEVCGPCSWEWSNRLGKLGPWRHLVPVHPLQRRSETPPGEPSGFEYALTLISLIFDFKAGQMCFHPQDIWLLRTSTRHGDAVGGQYRISFLGKAWGFYNVMEKHWIWWMALDLSVNCI